MPYEPSPSDHTRESNAVGCKPNWCTSCCYCMIGYVFLGAIMGAAPIAGIIGMWSLGPDLMTSVIWALGPAKMTGLYKTDAADDSYPPGRK